MRRFNVGDIVKVTVDPDRYSPSDYAYLCQDGHANGKILEILGFVEATLPVTHIMIELVHPETRIKEYLAESTEVVHV